MPSLTYRGDYGASQRISSPRTASLTCDTVPPSNPILVQTAYARIYVSTNAKAYTFHFHVETDGSYTGDLDYKFSSNDSPIYVDVPIDVDPLDPSFPAKTISTITVSETNGHGSSVFIRGTVRIIVDYAIVYGPRTPSAIRINGTTAINIEAGTTATLTWDAASVDQNDRLVGYQVILYDVAASESSTVTQTLDLSATVTAPYTDSKSYYYYIRVITLYYSPLSSTYASIYTYIQLTAPTVTGLGDYPVRNPRPMLLVQLGNGPIDEYLTLLADGWTASRKGFPGDKIYLRRNSAYTANTTEAVSMTETDERMRSVTSSASVSYAAPVYTDPEIIAGTSIVKAADISEMQTQLAMIRENYGMDEYWFTACLPQVTSLTLWSTHISEIQDCIREIQAFVNSWDLSSPSWAIILPTMLTTTGPSAAVIRQLRQIITML